MSNRIHSNPRRGARNDPVIQRNSVASPLCLGIRHYRWLKTIYSVHISRITIKYLTQELCISNPFCHPLVTSQPSMVDFSDPAMFASEICTNAPQSHSIIPGLRNTLFYSGGREVLARRRRFIYVRLPPPSPGCCALTELTLHLAGSSSPLLTMSGVLYESVGPTSGRFGSVVTSILGFVIPLK